MSTVLSSLVDQSPKDLEHNLTVTMRAIAHRALGREIIIGALAASEQLRAGLVISSEADAALVADLVAQVIDGEKDLAESVEEAIAIPKQMERAVRAVVADVKAQLAAAKATGNGARVAYQETLRRRAAEEKARLEKEAAEAARAAEEGGEEDIPPPLAVALAEVPRTVAGGTGKMGTQVRIEVDQIVDFSQVPREWLQLVPANARMAFQAAEKVKLIRRPEPGESVIYNGVRFVAKESAVNRRG